MAPTRLAGVVNFILDDTYVGLKGSSQTGESHSTTDNKDLDFSVTGGFLADGDRGHVVVSSGEAFPAIRALTAISK